MSNMPKKRGRPRLYKDAAARKRAQRAREAASRAHQLDAAAPVVAVVDDHADPVGVLATWAAETLIVPPGHPLAGRPMVLPPFAVAWLRESWDAHESALSTARKNAKSAIAAVMALGFLVGPLRRPGWRGAIASLDKNKAAELRRQVAEIAEASGLDVKVRRSPYPGVIESATGSLDTLSADRTAGHSSGYDLVIVDETGLFKLSARDLLAGLRSSVSARNGQIRHISIRGDSPLFAEILENPAVVSAVHAAPDNCAIDDEAAWRAANPGLGTIKSSDYMRAEVERVKGVSSDEPSFRAYDLNLTLSPVREMVCSPSDLEACFVDEPTYDGPCYLGLDIGESSAGSAAVAYWPQTGGLQSWLAFGDVPDLAARGRRDGADYAAMERRGELRTYPGRVVPVGEFVENVETDLSGASVFVAVADGYKAAELMDCSPWPLELVRSGSGPDGSAAVRAFQRAVLTRTVRTESNLSLASAIKESTLRRDGNGNPAVDSARSRGRIDVLSAAVLAIGAAARWPAPTPMAVYTLEPGGVYA